MNGDAVSGIGRAIAKELATQGAKVFGLDMKEAQLMSLKSDVIIEWTISLWKGHVIH